MVLWRISRHRDLRGTGGLKANGRWHDLGQPVVYLSESPSSALLEVCVHSSANDVPPDFTLLKIEAPDVAIDLIAINDLREDWKKQLNVTRELGTQWLRKNEGVLLQVPSAIVPHTANFLLNPLHPDAVGFQIVEALAYPFDTRIKK